MVGITNDKKVTGFWNYPIEKVNNETQDEIKMIVEFRERSLNKVKIGEWTEEEYKHFSSVIKTITINKFIELFDIADMLLELPREESKKEILHLTGHAFFNHSEDGKSDIHKLAFLISDLQAKLFSISNLPLTEEEKNNNQSVDKKIEVLEEILSEIKDDDSDYTKLFKETFNLWVLETFENEELKKVLLKQEEKLITIKTKNINNALKRIYCDKNKRIINTSYQYQAALKTSDKKALKRK